MAINVDEIEGSPTITMDRTGGKARRIVKIAQFDFVPFILEVFPGALTGYPFSASFPGFPWLVADSMTAEPWDPSGQSGLGEVPSFFPGGLKVTVDYIPRRKYDGQMQSGSGNDPSGPGGRGGSDAGQNVTFITHKGSISAEYLVDKSQAYYFETDKNGVANGVAGFLQGNITNGSPFIIGLTGQLNASGGDNPTDGLAVGMAVSGNGIPAGATITAINPPNQIQISVAATVTANQTGFNFQQKASADLPQVSIVIPMIQHEITWNFVAAPPWQAIRACIGCVNGIPKNPKHVSGGFAGAAPGTMLFNGCQFHRDWSLTGSPFWTLSYKFSEKNLNGILPGRSIVLNGVYLQEAWGWNYFLRSNGQFMKVRRKDGGFPFQYQDFSPLFIQSAI